MTATKPAHVWTDRRELRLHDDESFDRLAFAMQAMRMVKPPGMTVVIFEGRLRVHADRGRDLRGGPHASWGMLAVPPHASKADIAIAVASLAGRAHDPYVLDMLLTSASAPA